MAIRFDVEALAPGRSRGAEVEYDVVLPGDGAEAEVFFSDLSHEYVDDQRGLHDVRDINTLLEALPYIREFHGRDRRDQVRRRGDERPRAARGVRARRRPVESTSG